METIQSNHVLIDPDDLGFAMLNAKWNSSPRGSQKIVIYPRVYLCTSSERCGQAVISNFPVYALISIDRSPGDSALITVKTCL